MKVAQGGAQRNPGTASRVFFASRRAALEHPSKKQRGACALAASSTQTAKDYYPVVLRGAPLGSGETGSTRLHT